MINHAWQFAMTILGHLKHPQFSVTLTLISSFCHNTGHAANNPAQGLLNALSCFNNRLIYVGCGDEYRLDEFGNLNIPYEATDAFCNGPCLAETQLMLSCIDNIMSNFMFYNKATTRDIRNALRGGCSYANERGNFNVGDYIQSETSNSKQTAVPAPVGVSTSSALMAGWWLLLLHHRP